jgi:hypothetical protein
MIIDYDQKEHTLLLTPENITEAFELGQLAEADDAAYADTYNGEIAVTVALARPHTNKKKK